jgi:uncharacterized protein YggE
LDILELRDNISREVAAMKRILWPGVLLLLVAIIMSTSGCDGFTSPGSRINASGSFISNQNTGIWVTGEGKVTVVPDVAVLSVGVEAQANTVAQAQNDASNAMNAVKSELAARGIADKDITTQYFNINPVRTYVPDTGEEKLTGYRVTNMLTVKVRKVEDTGTVIDAVANAGGNFIRIDNISFTVDDPVPYQKEAREKALANARDRAKQIADNANLKLGEPTYINETTSYYPTPYQYGMGIPVPAPVSSVDTSINPGETTITVLMQVAYDIK